jgi:hypothetical protein
MISDRFKIEEFLKAVEEMDYDKIITTAQRECGHTENLSYSVKGAVKNRNRGSTEYAYELKKFIHFMSDEIHGDVQPRQENPLYRPVCESLVRRKQLRPVVLELFSPVSTEGDAQQLGGATS